ncbi:Lipoprotein-releasing system ATP-binding protein LolD [bacterium HR19]|nr:Lipoprotein-releasing system ATP-binding protein LolD [bacterium HR19]
MGDEVVIELIDIKKSFVSGGKVIDVLKGINLRVYRGELIAIVGASGSGKTTLLSIMGTILKPSSGKVIIDGKDVSNMSEKELEKIRGKKISFVFQNGYLIEELSPLENVEIISSRALGKKSYEIARKILSDFGVPERANVWELSGGEYQRVAIARAISVMPEILLADEPTGNLDSKTAETVMEEVIRICRENKLSMVVVTHNTEIAKKMDKIYRLADGKIVEEK